MARYAARRARVIMSPTGTSAGVLVLGLNKWTLNRKTDKIEVTAFGDANKTYVLGLPDTSGSISGFWDDTDDTMFSGAASDDGVVMVLYPDYVNKPTSYAYGEAYFDASMDAGVADAVTVSGDFAARSSWLMVNL